MSGADDRLKRQYASSRDGYEDAVKLIASIHAGGDAPALLQETLDKLTRLNDPDRLAAFHRAMAKGMQT
jgi:hypothetical protein